MGRQKPNSDQSLIELFLDMLAAERGAGEQHARGLSARSRGFLGRSRRQAAARSRAPTPTTCAAIWRRSASAALPPTSVARRLSAIRQLYRFLYAEGHRSDDPAAILEGPKRGRTLPKVLSIAEVDRLLAAARAASMAAELTAPERLRAARLTCLLEVLYATGLRVSELVALPASAAERQARMLIVRGKGGKERLVPLNDAAKRDDARLSGAARQASPQAAGQPAAKPPASRRRQIRNGCFPLSARAAISAASISPASSRRSRPPPACAPSR